MPAKSKSQQRFMGMVHAHKVGDLDTSSMSPEFLTKVRNTANNIKAKDAKDLAETKHKGLKEKVAMDKATTVFEKLVMSAYTQAMGAKGSTAPGGLMDSCVDFHIPTSQKSAVYASVQPGARADKSNVVMAKLTDTPIHVSMSGGPLVTPSVVPGGQEMETN